MDMEICLINSYYFITMLSNLINQIRMYHELTTYFLPMHSRGTGIIK